MHTVTTRTPKASIWLESETTSRFIYANVWAGYLASKFLGNFFLLRSRNVKITTHDAVHGSRYVIAANHQSAIDPFMICGQFPISVWKHMGSLRYFTANGFFNNRLMRPFLLGFGCFPARAHERYPYGLTYATDQLSKGRTVLIFPEGRRTKRGESPVRHGVEALAREHQVMIIPAHIEWKKGRFSRSFQVGIGKPFDGSSMTAEEIMDRVYAQPVR